MRCGGPGELEPEYGTHVRGGRREVVAIAEQGDVFSQYE